MMFGSAAFAGDARAPREEGARRAKMPDPRVLSFALQTGGQAARLDVELLLRGEVIMSEWRMVRAEQNRVKLLLRGADHFPGLRAQDAAHPGTVRVRIRQNGELVADLSLTEFDAKYAAPEPKPRRIQANGACEDNCQAQWDDCLARCDERSTECSACSEQYEECIGGCPTCSDWEFVDRTLLRRRYSGSANIIGAQYCNFEEYYLVEETNPAGCYPNRFVCDYDDDTIFYGFGSSQPTEGQCCDDNVGPGDENYCGGTDTTCG